MLQGIMIRAGHTDHCDSFPFVFTNHVANRHWLGLGSPRARRKDDASPHRGHDKLGKNSYGIRSGSKARDWTNYYISTRDVSIWSIILRSNCH